LLHSFGVRLLHSARQPPVSDANRSNQLDPLGTLL
jgi:hypothetical protein